MTVCSTTFVPVEVISVVIEEIDSTSSASESLTRRLPRAPVPNGNSILSEDRDVPIVKGRLDDGLLSLEVRLSLQLQSKYLQGQKHQEEVQMGCHHRP